MRLIGTVERPSFYRLLIEWETLENHTVDFRGSEQFQAWRALIGEHLAEAPQVEHVRNVLTAF